MIEVKHLHYTYPGASVEAISDINFTIKKGEIFGFLGPSGAGKSTTQKILIGLLKDFKGSVSVNDIDLSSVDDDYYEKIGVSFELPNHYIKLTAIENLQYFASLYENAMSKEDLMNLLEEVGLHEDADQAVSTYSKGMKNRLNFARSLLHRPEILFLDEPTAGLDPVNAERIKSIIDRKRREGVTIFLTTHDMHVADELCDRVAFIVDGKISITDEPKSLKLAHGKKSVKVEFGNSTTETKEFDLDTIGGNQEFMELLKSETVQTIHSQEATLAKVFIEVTGRSLD
ncbi:MAG: ABC transporter ATP-binding protein [Candidatus Kariarchaeaceae archaeon]|jgi:fluoroquinolone transport system ATP-binding protein